MFGYQHVSSHDPLRYHGDGHLRGQRDAHDDRDRLRHRHGVGRVVHELVHDVVRPGTAIALTAAPATGYTFSGWGGACSGAAACHVTITANTAVTATFVANVTLTATVLGSGTVTGSGVSCPGTCTQSYAPGTAITLTAAPATGYTFLGWGGACSGTAACHVTITADTTVTATFVLKLVTLTTTVAGTGSGTVTGSGVSCTSSCTTSFARHGNHPHRDRGHGGHVCRLERRRMFGHGDLQLHDRRRRGGHRDLHDDDVLMETRTIARSGPWRARCQVARRL